MILKMDNAYIVSGSFFGDEGKGSVVDYLSCLKNIKENVRYNGGSQASHTVVVDGVKHKFSQLGSILLNPDSVNYLSQYTVVNPFNIYTEAQVFSNKTGCDIYDVINRIYISGDSRIVTPYHKLIGQMKSIIDNNRGSVGSGVSQTTSVYEDIGIEIKMSDLINLDSVCFDKLVSLFEYTRKFLNENNFNKSLFNKLISDEDIYYLTDKDNFDYIFNCYKSLINSCSFNVCDIDSFHKNGDIMFEGSQGCLIDRNYGIRPNTTLLNTINSNGVKMASELNLNINRIGVITPFTSRHGNGILPTYDKDINNKIYDENQVCTFYQGSPRYGWFDLVLLKYSDSINNNDEYFMTQIDRLFNFDKVKICISYLYDGVIDDEFNNTFIYHFENNRVIITGIKNNSLRLKEFLLKCTPVYIDMEGFKEYDNNFLNFIYLIELYLGKKINYFGFGEDRSMKLERKRL